METPPLPRYRQLDFDRDLFGFRVAILDDPCLTVDSLDAGLRRLRAEKVRLVYWPTSPDPANQTAAARLGGVHVDDRTTFVRPLRSPPSIAIDNPTERYVGPDTATELESLAIASAEQSRFHTDPRVPTAVFEELYRRWIRNCVLGSQADAVLVIRGDAGEIAGMVTVGTKGDRGDIGLIAVDERYRGRGFGTSLVDAALAWSHDAGLPEAQVITQGRNVAARRLYEKCGYEVEKVEPYWHFWLD